MNLKLERVQTWAGGALGVAACYFFEIPLIIEVLLLVVIVSVITLLAVILSICHLISEQHNIQTLASIGGAGYGDVFHHYILEALCFGLLSVIYSATALWLGAQCSGTFLLFCGFLFAASLTAGYRFLVIFKKILKQNQE